jgi:FixJ family two-component response regulator
MTDMNPPQSILFVIDDDCRSRMAVAALALSLKIKCETFVSAEAFLDRYDPSLRGCVLVDFRLGGMDGLQLLERLAALGSALSTIVVSGYTALSLASRAMKRGAVAFIEKPYQNDDLADAVRKALDRGALVLQAPAEQAEERRPPMSAIVQSVLGGNHRPETDR